MSSNSVHKTEKPQYCSEYIEKESSYKQTKDNESVHNKLDLIFNILASQEEARKEEISQVNSKLDYMMSMMESAFQSEAKESRPNFHQNTLEQIKSDINVRTRTFLEKKAEDLSIHKFRNSTSLLKYVD